MAMDSAARVLSGTWGQVWLNGDLVAECFGLQAKMAYNKEEVPICGQMGVDTKITSYKGSGSMRMHKVSSRMARAIGADIRNGKDVRFTIISKLADPDGYGTERVALKNVSFDDLTLADWQAATVGTVTAAFTFSR